MILDKKIEIKISRRTKKYYNKNGYKCEVNDIINVDVRKISKGSHLKINVICDNDKCDIIKIMAIKTYYLNTKNESEKYYCNKCKNIKTKKTNLERYGVENVFQLEEIKKKSKETNLERYGVENVMFNETFKTKVENTKKEKYGDIYYNNHEKFKETNLERYGVEYPLQINIFKEKMKETCLEKYGVEHHLKSELIRDKISKTSNHNIFEKYKNINNSEYQIISYKKNIFNIKHKTCGNIFEISNKAFHSRKQNYEFCFKCYEKSTASYKEKEISKWLDSINIKYILNNRKILDGYELDIYIPDLNLAIEFNGVYWHSELYKEKHYHIKKTELCAVKGIQLLHIFEDDWNNKQNICKSIILNKTHNIEEKIYARKCIIKEVKSNIVRQFLNDNHIQGFSKSTYKFGLYYNNNLVSLMTFGYRRTNSKKEFELIRFCNKLNTSVIGSASKLFKYFLIKYKEKIEENYILSYADISLFNGSLYNTLGFDFIHRTLPNYFWVVNGIKEHRWKYNKQNLIKEGFDSNMTEKEIMYSRGYYRIYGCGQDRYEYHFK